MSKENNIKKGSLSEKMSNFSVEPPEGAWENIASQVPGGSNRRYLFIALAAAASLALAITIGVNLTDRTAEVPVARNEILQAESENDILEVESTDDVTSENIDEVLEESPLQIDETNKKDRSSGDEKTKKIRQTKLEEKVLIAMEEVIDEMEAEEGISVAENIERVQEEGKLADHETEQVTELDDQADTEKDEVDQFVGNVTTQEMAAQAILDSIASQNYLDSIARLAVLDEDVIPDLSDEHGKWQIGASLSPIFSYRDVSSADIIINQAANNAESGRLSYSGGVQISYLSSDRLSIESGLFYNRMGLAIGDFTSVRSRMDYWVNNVTFSNNSIVSLSNSIGTIATKNEDVFVNAYSGGADNSYDMLESTAMVLQDEVVNSFEQSLEYLEIPFNLKYKVINRDFKVLLIGGVSTNLLVGNNVSANTSNGKIDYGSVQDIRSVNYSGNAGLGFVYSFSENFNLSLEPRFRYFLNSINQVTLPTTRPYVIGLYTGLNYTF